MRDRNPATTYMLHHACSQYDQHACQHAITGPALYHCWKGVLLCWEVTEQKKASLKSNFGLGDDRRDELERNGGVQRGQAGWLVTALMARLHR